MTSITLDRERFSKLTAPHKHPGWLLKACPRCGGDMRLETDPFGPEDYTCLQCGSSQPSLRQTQAPATAKAWD
jgi:hypothetical protein